MASLYDHTVPTFTQKLTALEALLAKAGEQLAARKLDESVLLQTRLYPDMLPLVRQIQIAADFAKNAPARLAGVQPPRMADEETSFAQLSQRLASTREFLSSLTPAQFEGRESADITFPAGPGAELTLKGLPYLQLYALPNFYFHMTTAYAILRKSGFDIGKRDFIGAF